jgi:molecular chaperone DnaK (HSP70)
MNEKLKQFYKDNQKQISFSSEAKARAKDKIFSRLSEPQPEENQSFWVSVKHFSFKAYVLTPVLLVVIIFSTTVASANTVPGDLLYSVKRQVETVRVRFAPTPEAKLNLQVNFAEKRLQELEDTQTPASIVPQTTKPEDNSSETKKTKSEQKKVETKQNAEKALEFLEKNREKIREKGDEQKKERVEKIIDNLRTRLENSSSERDRNKKNNDSRERDQRDDTQSEDHNSEDNN